VTGLVQVVAAAIVRDGLLLAARRSAPHRLAGGWEFPGGKVESGEDETTALVRECREELGVTVEVGVELGETAGSGIRLVLYAAVVTDGEPAGLEDHDELRWLRPDELDSVPWLPIDLALLPAVRRHLRLSGHRGRL
jgi:8-oxo-dGTP diphosphatase